MQKEIPILFSTDMVRAKLAKIKTCTRRTTGLEVINKNPNDWEFIGMIGGSAKDKSDFVFRFKNITTGRLHDIKCPYGQKGDALWTRETITSNALGHAIYKADNSPVIGVAPTHYIHIDDLTNGLRGHVPSIHMKKKYARLWDEVTDIRVERLQDISEEGAQAEGLKALTKDGSLYKYGIPDVDGLPAASDSKAGWAWQDWCTKAADAFKSLWEKINGPNSWDANPWVWVVSFKVLSTTGKPEPTTEEVVTERAMDDDIHD